MPDKTTPLITPTELYEPLLGALRAWHATDDQHLLEELVLIQQARAQTATDESPPARRFVTNNELLTELEALRAHDERAADILWSRFLDERTIREVAVAHDVSPDTVNRLQRQAIEQLAELVCEAENRLRRARIARLESALPAVPDAPVFGVDALCRTVAGRLIASGPPIGAVVTGLGGIGKSTVLLRAVREAIYTSRISRVVWVEVPGGAQSAEPVALQVLGVLEAIGRRLPDYPAGLHRDALFRWLDRVLAAESTLIVIDNIEDPAFASALLDTVTAFRAPTRVAAASRALRTGQAGVSVHPIGELDAAAAQALIRYEAERLNLADIVTADEHVLQSILARTGGNPLAIKLVIGLATALPLDTIIADLAQARIANTVHLYRRIYQRVWTSLTPAARQLLQVMPLVVRDGGPIGYMQALSRLEDGAFWSAVEELVARSLLLPRGGSADRRYAIHRLTESFLQAEINRWEDGVEPMRKVVLWDFEDDGGSRYMSATLNESGDLTLSGQDLGRGVSQVFGRSEYEYAFAIKASAVPGLLDALGGEDDILAALQSYFGPERTRVKGFLDDHNVPYEFWSWVGD